jgi:hypothetical protein
MVSAPCCQMHGLPAVGPEKRHARLEVNKASRERWVQPGHLRRQGLLRFSISDIMWRRATGSRSFENLEVKNVSPEDILIMKPIANVEGDADDCAALIFAGLDFDVVY